MTYRFKILISSILIFTSSGCGLMFIGLENFQQYSFSSAEDAKIIIKRSCQKKY
ncbi:MAG: hypothetical protein IPG09_18545 [Ignavibacteria bacterium]|nr:hypothetical protein [Ignavibacteria bacterium]